MTASRTPVTLVVGLTGTIASGKSTVAALLKAKGATVIDADALAREAVQPGTAALDAIRMRWPGAMRPDGTLDRAVLRRIVFTDARERAALNAIVHPTVGRLRDERLEAARQRRDPIVVYDVPLLFEAGLESECDVIVVIDAPESVRRERLIQGRGVTAADADGMLASQIPAAEKRARAHVVIDNDGDTAALGTQVDTLWRALSHTLAQRSAPG